MQGPRPHPRRLCLCVCRCTMSMATARTMQTRASASSRKPWPDSPPPPPPASAAHRGLVRGRCHESMTRRRLLRQSSGQAANVQQMHDLHDVSPALTGVRVLSVVTPTRAHALLCPSRSFRHRLRVHRRGRRGRRGAAGRGSEGRLSRGPALRTAGGRGHRRGAAAAACSGSDNDNAAVPRNLRSEAPAGGASGGKLGRSAAGTTALAKRGTRASALRLPNAY
jgi:hypothetical protein